MPIPLAAVAIGGAIAIGGLVAASSCGAQSTNKEANTKNRTSKKSGSTPQTQTGSEETTWDDTESYDRQKTSVASNEEDDTGSDSLTSVRKEAAGSVVVSATGSTAEAARRAGIDRHAEAGLIEELAADNLARELGGERLNDGLHVFAPDNGVDQIIEIGSQKILVQAKHWDTPVGRAVLEECAEKGIDVLYTSNGVVPGVDPAMYDVEVLEFSDLPRHAIAKLEGDRIVRGVGKWKSHAKSATKKASKGILGRLKSVGKRLLTGAKSVVSRGAAAAKAAASWFLGLPLGWQLVIVVAACGTVYLVWRWHKNKSTTQPTSGATTAV
jgi:hypothetical protein